MKFKVYHAMNWGLNSDLHFADDEEFCKKNIPHLANYKPIRDNYKLVAIVETFAIGETFRLTNHIDKEWQSNEGVTAFEHQNRSTSVGDLVEDENGKLFLVASIGFSEVEWDESGDYKVFKDERRNNTYLVRK